MKKKDLWVFMIISIMIGLISSCQISDRELGEDLLPPGDNVFLYRDTIFEINAYPVSGKRLVSSELDYDETRVLLMGNLQDTLVGTSEASIITQFNTNLSFTSGPSMEIDSLMLFLYVQDYVGDMDQEITIRIHELTERIYMDSIYYSDFDPEGKINPIPLVEKSFMPEDGTMLDFLIEDQDFRDKFLVLGDDTALFKSDSIFKDYLNGLYIEAESASPDGSMARVHLAHPQSVLALKYANDSTQIDSIEGVEFKWSQFTIDPYFSQKISIFKHDHAGTYLSTIIDNDSINSPYCYVQGMAGVNTKMSFTSMEEWMEESPIAVSYATLVFTVVPEDESGILYDDLPDRLMLGTLIGDEGYEPVYDYFVLRRNEQGAAFGGYKKAESKGLFSDTTYTYRFKMPLHFQYMVDGVKLDRDFILQLSDGRINPKVSKLWSNLPANKKRIRLEVVYLKL
ncbi:MAG: DUF4270 family protein [Bacteroidota bacterium]